MLEVILERGLVSRQRPGDALDHDGEDGNGAGIRVTGVAVAVAEAGDAERVLHPGDAEVRDGDDGGGEEEVEPEEELRGVGTIGNHGGETLDFFVCWQGNSPTRCLAAEVRGRGGAWLRSRQIGRAHV